PTGKTPGGDPTGAPMGEQRPAGDGSMTPRPTENQDGTAPNADHARKTGDLQLDRFPKNPSPDLLRDLGMTEAEHRQFLKAAADLQRKRAAADATAKQRGAGTGGSASNTGAKRVQGGTDKPDELQRGGAALPPPEYRDGYKGYTEDVSKTPAGPKK